jgi:hypothetical protein
VAEGVLIQVREPGETNPPILFWLRLFSMLLFERQRHNHRRRAAELPDFLQRQRKPSPRMRGVRALSSKCDGLLCRLA